VVPIQGGTVSYINTGGGPNGTVIINSSAIAQAPAYQQYPGGYVMQPTAQPGGYAGQPGPYTGQPAPGPHPALPPAHPQQVWSNQPPPGPSTYNTQQGNCPPHIQCNFYYYFYQYQKDGICDNTQQKA
jgi:hypothetical protein